MERPQPRIIRLELQLATYFGDWMAHYEKAIQTLASNHVATMPKVESRGGHMNPNDKSK